MEYMRYQHIERYGNDEVDGINIGTCYVFPKIDGTNASVWLGDDGQIKAGSRTRELSRESDNAGFYAYIQTSEKLLRFFSKYPGVRLFGEWLVPHSLKTYENSAWRKFYIFDTCREDGILIPYDEYQPMIHEFDLDYIPALKIFTNASVDDFRAYLEVNKFLIQENQGIGEGIVIKNYAYRNKYGRQVWAKMVTNDFKTKNLKTFGASHSVKYLLEQTIIDEYLTGAFLDKELAKIVQTQGGWNSKCVPEFLGRIYHEFVSEELWNIVREHKNPTIDFKKLQQVLIAKTKEMKPEIFAG